MTTLQQKTILIVEDSGLDRDILSLFLRGKYHIITAENGLVAEQILESGQEVSLILLDIIMPVANGFDFLEWVQSKPEHQHIPIVFTSLVPTDENVLKGLKLGVRDVLFKPYDWGRVGRCVENMLTLSEYQQNCKHPRRAASEPGIVLIVDDSQISRNLLKETLGSRYKVLEAVDGREALELLRVHGHEIRLVLLDIVMPKMDGREMMKTAAAEKLLEHIPVIAVTSEDDSNRYRNLLDLGVHDIVKKPFSPFTEPSLLWHNIKLT